MLQPQRLSAARAFVGFVLCWSLGGCQAIVGDDAFDVKLETDAGDAPVEKQQRSASVQIYTHDSGLTPADAEEMKRTLREAGLQVKVLTHRDASAPDAAFIGALVSAHDARLVLRAVPYEIRYLFRPDYPAAEGGSAEGSLIGIGYMSTHYQAFRGEQSEPVQVTTSDLEQLSETGLSNAEFQRRLREITHF